jgi:hypothetical protein
LKEGGQNPPALVVALVMAAFVWRLVANGELTLKSGESAIFIPINRDNLLGYDFEA